MDPRVKAALKENHAANSMFMSVVSIMMRTIQSLNNNVDPESIDDMRETVIEKLASLLEPENIDLTCWPLVAKTMAYDEYLDMRKRTGKLTAHDLIRPGLIESNFNDLMAYFDHYQRVNDKVAAMAEAGAELGKVCSRCGIDKPLSSYKRGAVCNTCRSRAYRNRKTPAEEE